MVACSVPECGTPAVCRGMCNSHYQRFHKYGSPTAGRPPGVHRETCSANGCMKPTRTQFAEYCEVHYYRLRRTGSLDKKPPKGIYRQKRGYVVRQSMNGHPLANNTHSNEIYEHRVVYFANHGEGPFKCYHCGLTVTWSDMDVDHLNDTPYDNDPSNLVASCPTCNTGRGRYKAADTRRERHARWIEFNGERLTLTDWARRIGVAPGSVAKRIKNGWPLERALMEARGKTGPINLRRMACRSAAPTSP